MNEPMGGQGVFHATSGEPDPTTERAGRSRRRISVFTAVGLVAVILAAAWRCLTLWEKHHAGGSWVAGLRSPEASQRLAAVRELERVGRESMDAAIPALARSLGDPDTEVRAAAATAFASVVLPGAARPRPEHIKMAEAVLMPCLHDPQASVRAAATKAVWMVVVVGIEPSVEYDLASVTTALVEQLADGDPSVRLEAIHGLGMLGPKVSDDPPPALIAALDDESERNGESAAMALAAFKRGMPRLLRSVVRSLDARRPRYRKALIKLLEQVRAPRYAPAAVEGLVAASGSKDPEILTQAIAGLASFQDAGGSAAPELARSLDRLLKVQPKSTGAPDRTDSDLALAIVECLGRVIRGANEQKDAMSALAKALSPDREPRLRIAAAKTLGRFPPDPALFNALTAYIGESDPTVRHAVIWAIHDVDFAEGYVVPKALAVALEDPSTETRVDAAAAICHSGLGADPFVPALIQHALNDPVQEVRGMCATALSMLRGKKITAASIPHLIKGLDGTDPHLRESLCQALGQFGPDAVSAIPSLIPFLKKTSKKYDGTYQRFAAYALGRIARPNSSEADRVVAALVEVLQSPRDRWMTEATIEVLGQYGPKAVGAIPRLRELQEHDDVDVRKAATKALAKIQGAA